MYRLERDIFFLYERDHVMGIYWLEPAHQGNADYPQHMPKDF